MKTRPNAHICLSTGVSALALTPVPCNASTGVSASSLPPAPSGPPANEPSGPSERRFAWRGVELDGTARRGRIIATNAAAARAALRRRGIVVIALDERGRAAAPKANARDITTFTRHVASMLRAGLPLAQTLEVIARTPARSGVPRLAGALARSLNAGTTFAAALAHYPPQFDALYCQLAAVGEVSGSLAPVLERMAQERERAAVQRAKVRAALAYPTVVLLFAIAITSALLVWVVPAFQQVFEGFGAALPAPTRAVIALSDAALHYGGACAAVLVVAQLVLLCTLQRSHAARLALGKLTLAIPVIGRTVAALAAARWCRALGTLLASGIPLADALTSLTHATGHAVFDAASVEIALRLERGERLAAAMHATSTFPSTIIEPVAVAEESGALDAVLLDVAALAEREVDEAVGILTSVAEPLVVIMLGSLVGGLVVALYLPIIELGNVV